MLLFQDVTPAVSPWLSPNFLLSLAIAVIMAIAWLLRLEYKVNANAQRQADNEEGVTADLKRLEEEVDSDRQDTREWKKVFYQHATDTELHHNKAAFDEFRSGLERRFSTLESSILDMKTITQSSLREISQKLDRRDPHRTQG